MTGIIIFKLESLDLVENAISYKWLSQRKSKRFTRLINAFTNSRKCSIYLMNCIVCCLLILFLFCFCFLGFVCFSFVFVLLFLLFCSHHALIKDAQEDKKTQNLNVDTKKKEVNLPSFLHVSTYIRET